METISFKLLNRQKKNHNHKPSVIVSNTSERQMPHQKQTSLDASFYSSTDSSCKIMNESATNYEDYQFSFEKLYRENETRLLMKEYMEMGK